MEDFVTYGIAKKLKEKGFAQTFGVYGFKHIYYNEQIIKRIVDIGAYPGGYFGENVPCPPIHHVLKWLRDERGIYVAIDFFRFNGNTELWWTYTVRYIEDDSTKDIFESCKRKSWEEAALAGIEDVLDNLI